MRYDWVVAYVRAIVSCRCAFTNVHNFLLTSIQAFASGSRKNNLSLWCTSYRHHSQWQVGERAELSSRQGLLSELWGPTGEPVDTSTACNSGCGLEKMRTRIQLGAVSGDTFDVLLIDLLHQDIDSFSHELIRTIRARSSNQGHHNQQNNRSPR